VTNLPHRQHHTLSMTYSRKRVKASSRAGTNTKSNPCCSSVL